MEKNYDRLFAITVSKNYANELSIMLDKNAKYFDKWYIITQEDDLKTIELIKTKNLSNIEIVYYPLVPDAIKEHHVKSPLKDTDLEFSYPSHLKRKGRRDISPKIKRKFKLTFDKGASIRSVQKIHILKENPTKNDLILILDSDIVLPENFQDILNSKKFSENTLYGANRYDFMFYSDFSENKNSTFYDQLTLAGFFHLYKYDSSKLCKRTHGAEWVDTEFKSQFQYNVVFNDLSVSHLGAAAVNWSGKQIESFIHDTSESILLDYIKENEINCNNNDDKKKCITEHLQFLQLQNETYKQHVTRKNKNKLNSVALMVSVNYNDFLQYLLPINSQQFDKIIVLTIKSDKTCIEICEQYDKVECLSFDDSILNFNELKFNKGHLLNQGLDYLNEMKYDGVLTLTDSDIMFPTNYKHLINTTTNWTSKLYTLNRYDCADEETLTQYFKDLDLTNLRLYPASWLGYCQILKYNAGRFRFSEKYNADGYDIEFIKHFKKRIKKRDIREGRKLRYLSKDDVLIHLGIPGKNWSGRITEEFFKNK